MPADQASVAKSELADAHAAAETDAGEMARLREVHDSAVRQYFDREVSRLLVHPETQVASNLFCTPSLGDRTLKSASS